MGICPSTGETREDLDPHYRASHIIPGEFTDKKLAPSEKNDNKFFFIPDEENIDMTINTLDEVPHMYESNAALLEETLEDLRALQRFVDPSSFRDSGRILIGGNSCVQEADEKAEADEAMSMGQQKMDLDKQELKIKNANPFGNKNAGTGKKIEVQSGFLKVEIQKAKFMHIRMINKNSLASPFVVVKIYSNKNHKVNAKALEALKEVQKYETKTNQNNITPEWVEIFEHQFEKEDKLSYFMFGISLFYTNQKTKELEQIGEEQYFSIGSLMDQKVQEKEIDFKQEVLKGTLARVRVRFQFVYDLGIVKERLLREIKTRIERLNRIRERHPIFATRGSGHGRATMTPTRKMTGRVSRMNSMLSISSCHDDDDNRYFVDDE